MQVESIKNSMEKAVGFHASLSNVLSRWDGIPLFGWQGHVSECEIESADQAMLILHVAGAVTSVKVRGRQMSRPSAPGLLTIVPSDSVVQCSIHGFVRSISLHFDVDETAEKFGRYGISGLRARCGFHNEFLAAAIRELAEEVANPRENGQLYADSLANAISLHLRRDNGASDCERVVKIPKRMLDAAVGIIETSIECGISLDHLATSVGLSRAHFSRLFKEFLGVSPHRYLTQRRIEKAKALLLDPYARIAEIALDCGFSSQAHFTTCFGRLTGMTPLSFRRENGGLVSSMDWAEELQ